MRLISILALSSSIMTIFTGAVNAVDGAAPPMPTNATSAVVYSPEQQRLLSDLVRHAQEKYGVEGVRAVKRFLAFSANWSANQSALNTSQSTTAGNLKEAQHPKESHANPTFVNTLPLNAIIPNATRSFYDDYTKDEKSVEWLAEQLGIRNFTRRYLGLSRSSAVHALPLSFIETHEKTQPDAVRALTEAVELAGEVKSHLTQLQVHYAMATNLIPSITQLFMTPKDLSQVWSHLSNLAWLLIWSSGPISMLGQPLKIIIDMNAFAGKPEGPSATTHEALTGWAHEQMDLAIDAYYGAYRMIFQEGTSSDLEAMRKQFFEGKIRVDAGQFLHEFKLGFSQRLCNGNPVVANYRCIGELCRGGLLIQQTVDGVDNVPTYWRTNLPTPALKYLQGLSVSWDDFFQGRNGWNITKREYTCEYTCALWKAIKLNRGNALSKRSLCPVICDGPKAFKFS